MSCDRRNAWTSKNENSNWNLIESFHGEIVSRCKWNGERLKKQENILISCISVEYMHVFGWLGCTDAANLRSYSTILFGFQEFFSETLQSSREALAELARAALYE